MSRPARTLLLAGTIALAAAACASPEAARTRGDGAGADVGNRDPLVTMHGGSRIYYGTPCLLPDDKCEGPLPYSGLPGDFPDHRPTIGS